MSKVVSFPSAQPAAVPDAAERDRALDIRSSWIVEAPAGSGKTGLLIQRYLKLLTDDSVTEPEQVLALTFTVKATAEMRSRVVEYLEAAQRTPDPAASPFHLLTHGLAQAVLVRSHALGWNLLAQPQRMNIRTIDSLSAEIVRTLPILSGSGGARRPTTLPEALHREAARRTLMLLGGEELTLDEALRTLLRHRDGNLAGCERLIAQMLASREQWGRLVPLGEQELEDSFLDSTVLPRLERTLDEVICRGLARLSRAMPEPLLTQLTALAVQLAHNPGYNGIDSPIAHCAALHTPPGETAEHLAHWRAFIHLLVAPSTENWRSARGLSKNILKFETSKKERDHLAAILNQIRDNEDILQALLEADSLPPAQYPQEQWLIAKALFRILRHAMVELTLLFAERNECDYTEVTLGASAALTHDSGSADYTTATGMRLQHLLVDEMQDTSLSQYGLIEQLTRGWDGHSQTLFLVGDPKQSIYLFRQARVERFLRVLRDSTLGELPLGRLRLTANFRSQQQLVRQFNDDFSTIFPSLDALASPTDVPFIEAAPVRADTHTAGLCWHTHLINKQDRPRQQAADAQAICTIIAQWQTRPLPPKRLAANEPWKIAILVRSRSGLEPLVQALKQAGIPFRAVNVEPLSERREVLDLFALTRALLHPADRVAWLAILRASWCGLSLADLHLLTGADDPQLSSRSLEALLAERMPLLTADARAHLQRTWTVLQDALAQQGRLPIASWVERTWRTLGGDATLSAEELANTHAYLQLLDQIEREDPFLDLALLAKKMGDLYAQPAARPGAIDLMTIHAAKGLEWDLVLVPGLERSTRSSTAPLLSWVEIDLPGNDDAAHVLLAPIHGAGEDSSQLNRWIAKVQRDRDAAERKRLFYVACTRAAEELHLFATRTRKTNGDPAEVPYDSLLKAAWPAAQHHLDEEAAPEPTIAPAIQIRLDEPGLALAAAGSELTAANDLPTIQRLPLSFDPRARFQAESPSRPTPEAPPLNTLFHRPEGSFAARALGNAIHAGMEQLAQRIAADAPVEHLLAELPTWEPRLHTLLRQAGLPPTALKQRTTQALRALQNTLNDPIGRWLLAPHPNASSELALSLDAGATVRLDRIFRAGPQPESPGSIPWILDFKTTEPAGLDHEAFFHQQRDTYRPQMETYARALLNTIEKSPIHLGLYYPLAQRLVWWIYQD